MGLLVTMERGFNMTKFLSHFNKLSKLKIMSLVGGLLLVIGLIGVSPTLYFRWTDTGTASASPVNANQVWGELNSSPAKPVGNLVTGYPTYISIPNIRPALNMNVPIITGVYNKTNNSWTLSDSSAMFAPISSQPNNVSGNTFIYGHYRPNVFAYLHLIKPGTIATITTSNGYQFTYKFIGSYAVVPTDTTPLSYSGTPVLTIQTCSGTFFQNRQMYIFSYNGYTKVSS
jgi:hypothetical protein